MPHSYVVGASSSGKLESFRNKEGYAMLEKALREEGYVRSAKQIQVKLRDLKAGYRKCKEKNNRSGNGRTSCPFYQELDVVLGTRPATEPSFLLETTGHADYITSFGLCVKMAIIQGFTDSIAGCGVPACGYEQPPHAPSTQPDC
ncbi:hypothetical protein Bbelb_343460 [Branchiostoma belcheri]|nr:hypothetical protein Bbelb_343460 [Branchiostoma belcheri]